MVRTSSNQFWADTTTPGGVGAPPVRQTIPLRSIVCLTGGLGLRSLLQTKIYTTGSIKFAQERSAENVAKEKAIFCLGPDEIEEVYFNDGKETKKIARFARMFDSESVKMRRTPKFGPGVKL